MRYTSIAFYVASFSLTGGVGQIITCYFFSRETCLHWKYRILVSPVMKRFERDVLSIHGQILTASIATTHV